MRVAMPTGDTHGWGIAGTYLSREIAKLPPIEGVTLHSVAGHQFAPSFADQWDRINVGYCFFESEIIAYRHIPEAARRWDHMVAGSSWCEYHLRIAGMDRTSTILQGIDPLVFSPQLLRDQDGRFIVFSGGKFEFRKGHDLVIAAMRVFMQRHPDAWLACAWHNHWPMSIRTMEQSRQINFRYQDGPCEELYLRLLADHGIPVERVVLYPVLDNRQMRQAYLASDVGLFPNRCEGGNNMVMCEYMACGRPVIASPLTGHRDVLDHDNALCFEYHEPVLAVQDGVPTGVWFEASVDEALELLEKAYRDRSLLERVAHAGARSMTRLSWQAAAQAFHALGSELFRQATRCEPGDDACSAERAARLFDDRDYQRAAEAYRLLLQRTPLDPNLHNNLGTVLDRLERYAEAVLHYEKALAFCPGFFEARFNLANCLKRLGDVEGAIKQLEQVLASHPDFVQAWQNLALCRLDREDVAGAVLALEQAVLFAPDCLKAHADLGELLIEQGRFQEALACFDQVLGAEPDNAGVLNSKGVVLQRLDDLDGAEACYRRILSYDPDNTLALNNLGAVMRCRALPEQALVFFNRAFAIDPGDSNILFNRSLCELLLGDFESGWKDYESRFSSGSPVLERHKEIPRWNGEPLAGKRVLAWCEQGYGDSIQFVRYVGALVQLGATVVLEVQDAQIAPLLATADGVGEVVIKGGGQAVVADFQIPLLSLPRWFGNLPCPPQYLRPRIEPAPWLAPLHQPDCRLKVGLAWAGRPTHHDDRNRSLAAQHLEAFAACEDLLFVNLQFSPAEVPAKPDLLDLRSHIKSFADSAALILKLDLVVTVDTAIAHLAGALGVPVWILLPYNPDWRWLLGQKSTPWYGSARLFRQNAPFAWDTVITDVLSELKQLKKIAKALDDSSR